MLGNRADLIFIPKQKPLPSINKYPRPFLLTLMASKLAEDVPVMQFIKQAILKTVDYNKCGTVPKSSTTHA